MRPSLRARVTFARLLTATRAPSPVANCGPLLRAERTNRRRARASTTAAIQIQNQIQSLRIFWLRKLVPASIPADLSRNLPEFDSIAQWLRDLKFSDTDYIYRSLQCGWLETRPQAYGSYIETLHFPDTSCPTEQENGRCDNGDQCRKQHGHRPSYRALLDYISTV